MRAAPRMRGQPVMMLVLLMGGWVALRATLWETPFAHVAPGVTTAAVRPVDELVLLEGAAPAVADEVPAPLFTAPGFVEAARQPSAAFMPGQLLPQTPAFAASGGAAFIDSAEEPQSFALPNPFAIPAAAPYRPFPGWGEPPGTGRWSADGWVLLRRDTTTAVTSGRGSYGNSQVGAVLRYRLAPSSYYRPVVYLRASKALAGAKESEAALGLSARPIPPLPLRAAIELRATRADGKDRMRPAAYAVTELPPVALPLGFTGEAYGQAGYVGGKYSTSFVDGQVRAERTFAEAGPFRLSAGGGVWGGAQKGASRLDAGPSASVGIAAGKVNSRVSLDWRFRVAGHANPSSGPTLTISAGF